MTKAELIEIITNGENSRVEFKRDNCDPSTLAKEISALLNSAGGVILLGVEDDGQISGLSRSCESAEEWVMNIARQNVQPAVSPAWFCTELASGRNIGVIELISDSPGKPHKAKSGRSWTTFTRIGSSSRTATREEEARLYQAAKLVRYEIRAVPDTGLESLDMDRIKNYYREILNRETPAKSNLENWMQLLINADLMLETDNDVVASVAGVLLFGHNPNRRLPQAGITAVAFPGVEKDYSTIDEERIRGPLTPLVSTHRAVLEKGVIDRAVDFVARNMGHVAWLEGARRHQKSSFALKAVREAIVNAVAHRDYGFEGTDIEVSLYSDRLEVISPGKLPNGVTIAKMKEGIVRVARNELLKEILRDYRYVEHYGMGIRNLIIEETRLHNGTKPELEEQEDRFVVRLWKGIEDATQLSKAD